MLSISSKWPRSDGGEASRESPGHPGDLGATTVRARGEVGSQPTHCAIQTVTEKMTSGPWAQPSGSLQQIPPSSYSLHLIPVPSSSFPLSRTPRQDTDHTERHTFVLFFILEHQVVLHHGRCLPRSRRKVFTIPLARVRLSVQVSQYECPFRLVVVLQEREHFADLSYHFQKSQPMRFGFKLLYEAIFL